MKWRENMKSREELIRILEKCANGNCEGCPYSNISECTTAKNNDLLEFLRAIGKTKEICEEMYEEGLKDAWSMAKKIAFIDREGALTRKEFDEIFGGKYKDEVFKMTPMAVKRKIDEWAKTCNFHVGDVVKYNDILDMRNVPNEKGVITKIENGKASVLWSGYTIGTYPINELILTGKHIDLDQIFELLNEC